MILQTVAYDRRFIQSRIFMQDDKVREVQWAQLSRGDFELLFLKLAEQVGNFQPRIMNLSFVFSTMPSLRIEGCKLSADSSDQY